mmetsp:Transcript_47069/g.142962  ORF Transcript_47069/g.142962 Transcript_47069/m.142962 type:complete len:224 (+) Transcript_47069:385-1056(+)
MTLAFASCKPGSLCTCNIAKAAKPGQRPGVNHKCKNTAHESPNASVRGVLATLRRHPPQRTHSEATKKSAFVSDTKGMYCTCNTECAAHLRPRSGGRRKCKRIAHNSSAACPPRRRQSPCDPRRRQMKCASSRARPMDSARRRAPTNPLRQSHRCAATCWQLQIDAGRDCSATARQTKRQPHVRNPESGPLRVGRKQAGVLHQSHHVSLGRFLQGPEGLLRDL